MKKILYIHSYFEEKPSIVCSNDFVNSMISPNPEAMSKYQSTQEHISKDIEVVKDDVLVYKILEVYDQSERSSERSLKLPDKAMVYHSLFEITSEDIMPMIGLIEDSHFDNNSFLQ